MSLSVLSPLAASYAPPPPPPPPPPPSLGSSTLVMAQNAAETHRHNNDAYSHRPAERNSVASLAQHIVDLKKAEGSRA